MAQRRTLVVSLLLPLVLAVLIPAALTGFGSFMPGWWELGWIWFVLGVSVYVRALRNLFRAGARLMRTDIYAYSRNPMYLGMLLMVAGEAIALASVVVLLYFIALAVALQVVIVRFEEPFLNKRFAGDYSRYAHAAPRWFRLPRTKKAPTQSEALARTATAASRR